VSEWEGDVEAGSMLMITSVAGVANGKHVTRATVCGTDVRSDRLCGLVVRVPGYTTEMYCDSCEVGTEFILVCYVEESRPPLWSSGQSSWLHNGDVLCFM
jgi:hypothetical protein